MVQGKGYRQGDRGVVHGGYTSRRRMLRGAALASAGLVMASLIGCGERRKPTSTAEISEVKRPKLGGTFSHMNGQETQGLTLDPQTDSPHKGRSYRLWYQGLLGYHPETYEVEPELAQAWEQPSVKEYVFKLQPAVRWHNKAPVNGRELVADDIVFSLNRVRSPGGEFIARSLLDTVDKIQAIDKTTLKLTTNEVDAPLLSKLSADNLLVIAPEVLERTSKLATADVVVGTGPFILQSVEERVGAYSIRNPDYWKPGLPYLDAFRTKHFGNPGDLRAWAALLAGELDVVVVPGEESKKAQQNKEYAMSWFKNTGFWAATPNVKVKPFDDARVTRALRLLIDHQEFITAWAEVWFGRGGYASVLPASLDEWDLTHDEYSKYIFWQQPKDTAVREALALLSAAGYTKDKPLKMELMATGIENYGGAAAVLLQAQWRRLGQGVVDAQVKFYDNVAYQQVRARREYGYGMISTLTSFNEIDTTLRQYYYTGASRNYWEYSDAKLDMMIDKQRTIFDVRQRKTAVREIITYMIDNFPGVSVSHMFILNAAKRYVHDFHPEFWLDGRQFERVWLDL